MNARIPENTVKFNVATALQEDLGSGDVTAALVPQDKMVIAKLISRESTVLCGRPWFEGVFSQLNASIEIDWRAGEGDYVRPGSTLCEVRGPARPILSGERSALNFLQMLSGVASHTRKFVERVKGTEARILDTRKTLPGLRAAQKYAVAMGGGTPHRMGLFDAFLVKENHIMAAGSLGAAIETARSNNPKNLPIMVEAETLNQVEEALAAAVDVLLLDNFETHLLAKAVNLGRTQRRYNRGHTLLEASGGITLENVREIADTGVDRISIGGLTKNIRAIDLSLRFDD